MKISGIKINNSPANSSKLPTLPQKISHTFANMDDIGEGTSIVLDFAGKAVIVPLTIMSTSKESKETTEYNALKHPVAGLIQLLIEVPTLILGRKYIKNSADKGHLDKELNRQYNEKFYEDIFISDLKNSAVNSHQKAEAGTIIEKINKKGLSKKTIYAIDGYIETIAKPAQEGLKKTFSNYKTAHTKLGHLQNRLCFAAAILLTPLICALENKLHPIVMDKLYEKKAIPNAQNKEQQNKTHQLKHLSIHNFISHIKKGRAVQ